MVMASWFMISNVMLLCICFISCNSIENASINHHVRRSLVEDVATMIFDVTEYGAKADGRTDNAQAFMKTWNAACKSPEPATVLIPNVGTYMVGQVEFQGPCSSLITFKVEATILSVTDITAFPSPEWFSFESLDNLVVTGGGSFDGRGPSVWKFNNCKKDANCQLLPTSIKFIKVNNGTIRNITSTDSKSFHLAINFCSGITVENLSIIAPDESPNTDGIHISRSTNINIIDTVIGTGDDCISIAQGSHDINVTAVTCGPGHGISVGSLGKYKNEEDVSGINVKNCTLKGTTNGVRIKTWPGSSPSKASTINFEDIILEDVKNPIIIDQNYLGLKSGLSAPSNVQLTDIHYKNIRGTSASPVAVNLGCSPAVPCEGLELHDIDISFNGASATSSCLNAKIATLGTQNPVPCNDDQ